MPGRTAAAHLYGLKGFGEKSSLCLCCLGTSTLATREHCEPGVLNLPLVLQVFICLVIQSFDPSSGIITLQLPYIAVDSEIQCRYCILHWTLINGEAKPCSPLACSCLSCMHLNVIFSIFLGKKMLRKLAIVDLKLCFAVLGVWFSVTHDVYVLLHFYSQLSPFFMAVRKKKQERSMYLSGFPPTPKKQTTTKKKNEEHWSTPKSFALIKFG